MHSAHVQGRVAQQQPQQPQQQRREGGFDSSGGNNKGGDKSSKADGNGQTSTSNTPKTVMAKTAVDDSAQSGFCFGGGNGGAGSVDLTPGASFSALEKEHAANHITGNEALPMDAFAEVSRSLSVLMLHAQKSYDEAENEYRGALRANESFEWAHNNLGLLLMNVRNDYDGAEKSFRRALELDPSYPWARNNLGLLLFEVRQEISSAEAEFRAAIELDPHHKEAHCNLATLLNGKGERIEETGADLQTAAAIYMEAADHWEVRHGKHNNYSRGARGKAAHLMGITQGS